MLVLQVPTLLSEVHGGGSVSRIFCKTCGWNLVKVETGTRTKWGISIEGNQYYYNHYYCDTGEECVEVTA
jgi:hypothetical protein